MKHKPFLLLLLIFAGYVVMIGTRPVDAQTALFFDDFESYTASPVPVISLDNPPGASQYAPPHPPWRAASGSLCTPYVNCETWGDVSDMGPNTIWAITSERAFSGKSSLLIGMNDLAVDKTEAHIFVDPAQLPTNGILHWEHMLWASNGFNTDRNHYTIIMYGGRLVYRSGALGKWFFSIPDLTGKLHLADDSADTFVLPTQQWVLVDMVMDLDTRTYLGLCVNGQQVLPNLSGQPFSNTFAKNLGYVFGMWVTSSNNGQSRAQLGDNGLFAFIDDVRLYLASSVTCTPPVFVTTTQVSESRSIVILALPLLLVLVISLARSRGIRGRSEA